MTDDIDTTVIGIVAATLKLPVSELDPDLGVGECAEWDSVGHLALLMAVEKSYGITFDIDEMLGIETIQDIVDAVARHAVR